MKSIALALLMIVMGMFSLMTGLHNVDNSWNMMKVESDRGINLMDCNSLICAEKQGQYNLGVMSIMSGAIAISLSSVLLVSQAGKAINAQERR